MGSDDIQGQEKAFCNWFNPIEIDERVCSGCNRCVDACMSDVFEPNPVKGGPPIVMYPDECWYGGACLLACPLYEKGAIRLKIPLFEEVAVS